MNRVGGEGGIVGGLERMRGNVTLHACIGGDGQAGAFPGDVPLSGAIDGDGGTRTAGPDTHGYTIRQQVGGNRGEIMAHCWRDGQVEGVFYGPQNALEAAGSWWLPATESEVDEGVLGIVGSFGVKAPTSP